jgi:glutathione S-transferase kappa 1
VSPYSAFAWHALLRLRPVWNLELELKPFFLGGIMQGSGNQPPAMLPARAKFMAEDVARNAILFDFPLLPSPANFFSGVARQVLRAQRTIQGRILDGAPAAEVEALVTAMFFSIHADPDKRSPSNELDIDDAFLLAALRKAGLSEAAAAQALRRAAADDVKRALTANTETALEAGAYGSPTMFVHVPGRPQPMMLFGSDRFEQLAKVLGLPYPGVGKPPPGQARL